MPKRKKPINTESPAGSTTNESKVLFQNRQNIMEEGNVCPDCGEPWSRCACDQNLPHVVVPSRNVDDLPPSVGSARWDVPDRYDAGHYSLPPYDKSHYDVRSDLNLKTELPAVESGTSQISFAGSHKSNKDEKLTTRWTEEFLVKSPRSGCWCTDCPWLVAYGVLMLLWILLVGVCFFQKHLPFLSPTIMSANCLSTCSQLTPPAHLSAAEKAGFHCTPHEKRWVESAYTGSNNSNCIEDCKSYRNVGEFNHACTIRFPYNDDEIVEGAIGLSHHPNFINEAEMDWHWIAHVMVVANTVSLFLLLVPLFFCCLQVVLMSVTCVIINIALSILLWRYVYIIIKDLEDAHGFSLKDQFFIEQTVFAWLSTLLTAYVIAVALFVITKRQKVTCEVARFTSKFVNSVPSVLLEALLTLILLLLWVIALLCASIIIERGGEFDWSEPIQVALPNWFIWTARTITVIVAFWTAQFIINCQTIIVHGTMARFYFDKKLVNRVMKSHRRLLKYHLCTACFAGILFNWLSWLRWIYPKSIFRSRSLFGTAMYGLTFLRAGKEVNRLLHPPEGSRLRAIVKVNPFYFLMHIQTFALMAIVTHLVFFAWKSTLYIQLILVFYAYFVSLATVNIYKVTKDSIFLCYELDRCLTNMNPARLLKMPDEDSYLFARQDTSRVSPR